MSQDLTNTILLELLATNNEMLKIFSTLGQAEMASKYINYSKEEHEKALNEKQLQEKNTANWLASKHLIGCFMLGLSIFLPLASTVFTALQNAYTFSSKKLLCSAMVWSLSFFGKDCPDTSWKKNEKKRGDHQPILDKYGI
jgi:hypothetical protein